MNYLLRGIALVRFVAFYAVDLMKANIKVLLDIIGIKQPGKLTIYSFHTSCLTDLEYFILSNLITFSPGTICVEADPQTRIIQIHDMFHEDTVEAIRFLKEKYEKPLLYILSGRVQ